jgi:hypothetical protein
VPAPGAPNDAVVRYLLVRWAVGDHRRQTHQLARYRAHGGHIDNTRWSRCWGLARQRWWRHHPPSWWT